MSIASDRNRFVLESRSPQETVRAGEELGKLVEQGDVICLTGSLGSGKTVFVKGLAVGMGVADSRSVTSPSFTLIHGYEARIPLYHVDAFRLDGSADLEALGSDEMFYGGGVVAVEWADRVASTLPDERLDILSEVVGPSVRKLEFVAKGERAEKLLQDFATRTKRDT